MTELTRENLLGLSILQKKDGYRFSVDPLILAGILEDPSGNKAADFGTGCGIISLALSRRFIDLKITAFELQDDLFGLAKRNVIENDLEERILVVKKDILKIDPVSKFDLVVSNPPYIKRGAGRINPNLEASVARHEIHITLEEIVKKAAGSLKDGGRFAVIYPVLRLSELKEKMDEYGINPATLTLICSKEDRKPELFVIEGIKGKKPGNIEEKTFHIYQDNGKYSIEMERIFSGRFEN